MSAATKKKNAPLSHEKRFRPLAYELNWPVVADLPLTITDESGAPTETTIGQVIREAMPRRFAPLPDFDEMLRAMEATQTEPEAEPEPEPEPIPEIEEGFGSIMIRTPTRRIRVDALGEHHFPVQMLRRVLELWRLELGTGYNAQLYFYGSDSGRHESTWWEHYRFFVVVGDAVVQDSFELSSLCEHDIDENVLKRPWYVDEHAAETPENDTGFNWWYRKFYTETRAGQLIVMRSDGPRIFHYLPPEHREAANAANLARIAKASSWVAAAAVVAVAVTICRLLFGGR